MVPVKCPRQVHQQGLAIWIQVQAFVSSRFKPTQVTVGGSGRRHGTPRAQSCVDFRERGSPVRNFVPALHHQGVDPRGTRLGARQQLSRPDHVDHFLVAVPIIRLQFKIFFSRRINLVPQICYLQSIAVSLPEDDSVTPNITLSCEFAVQY